MLSIQDATPLANSQLERDRLADDRLDLFLPERMWEEAKVELPRPIAVVVRRRGLDVRIERNAP